MKWTWHVARKKEMRKAQRILVGNFKGRNDFGLDIRIQSKWTLNRIWGGVHWTYLAQGRNK
jgi:hypothetical protein